MRLEITPVKIVPNAITVWNEAGDADVVMDLKNLTFKENYFDEIFVFHVLDHLFENEIGVAMKNWKRCLKAGGRLFIIVDDFEYIARAFLGGDMTIAELNANFMHPTQVTRESFVKYFTDAGFPEGSVHIWFENVSDASGVLIPKQDFELVYDGIKNE